MTNSPKLAHPVKSDHSSKRLSVTAVSLTMLTVVLWGGTPVAISFAVEVFPPFASAGFRFFLATFVMWFWNWGEGVSLRLESGQWRPCMIAGFLLFVQIGIFTVAVKWSNSSHGSLFINTYIFWVAAIEHFVTGTDRLTVRKLVGLMLAALGVVVAITYSVRWGGGPNSLSSATLVGDILILVSAGWLGIKIVYTKVAVRDVAPGKLIFWHDVFGVLLFFAYSAIFENFPLDLSLSDRRLQNACLGLLYDGLFVAGLCFGINARLLGRYSASQISVFSFATPLFGILFAVLFRGDPLSAGLAVAGLCVGAGILIVNWPAKN